jgi:hypothetical protein
MRCPLYDFLQFLHESGVTDSHPLATLQILLAVEENQRKATKDSPPVRRASLSELSDEIAVFEEAKNEGVTPGTAYNTLLDRGEIG